jgi:hypothetical protein
LIAKNREESWFSEEKPARDDTYDRADWAAVEVDRIRVLLMKAAESTDGEITSASFVETETYLDIFGFGEGIEPLDLVFLRGKENKILDRQSYGPIGKSW